MEVLLMVLFAVMASATPRTACLNGHPTIAQEYTNSWAVVVARVVGVHPEPTSKNYLDRVTYVVRVEEDLLATRSRRVEVFSENSSGRFPMASGARYLLFLYRDLGRTMVDSCGNSGRLPASDETLRKVRQLEHAR
jgi:hypothetical protein